MALKRGISFDELVRMNREQILKDRKLLSEIEENIDKRMDARQNKKDAK